MTAELIAVRRELVACARAIHARGLSHGSTGNISVRVGERMLVTATGTALATITDDELSLLDLTGTHLDGPAPSKEAFLHTAMLRARPEARAVVHTHSTHAAAVSALAGLDPDSALPPLTAYFVMKVGRLPLLPFFAPGASGYAHVAEDAARTSAALLLRNHGPIAAGPTLRAALETIEEIEETARLALLLHGRRTNFVPPREDWRDAPPHLDHEKEDAK